MKNIIENESERANDANDANENEVELNFEALDTSFSFGEFRSGHLE